MAFVGHEAAGAGGGDVRTLAPAKPIVQATSSPLRSDDSRATGVIESWRSSRTLRAACDRSISGDDGEPHLAAADDTEVRLALIKA